MFFHYIVVTFVVCFLCFVYIIWYLLRLVVTDDNACNTRLGSSISKHQTMHSRMDSENSESKVLKSQLHRNARILRATTIHEKRMRQILSPASFYLGRHASVHQAVVNYGNAAYVYYPIPMMQKLARFRRMLALRAKRMGCHPPTEFRYGSIQQISFPIIPMLFNRFDSNTGMTGGSGGGTYIFDYSKLVAYHTYFE